MNGTILPSVRVNGVRMSYREAGEGEPLLTVHGNFGSSRWFNDQLESRPPDSASSHRTSRTSPARNGCPVR